jgi:hypothetical protein
VATSAEGASDIAGSLDTRGFGGYRRLHRRFLDLDGLGLSRRRAAESFEICSASIAGSAAGASSALIGTALAGTSENVSGGSIRLAGFCHRCRIACRGGGEDTGPLTKLSIVDGDSRPLREEQR